MLKCHGADLQDRPSRSTCTALHFGAMLAHPVRRVAFHRPRTRCLFAQVDSPRRPSVLLPSSGRSVGTAGVLLFVWCVRPTGQSFVFWYCPGPLNTFHMRRTARDLRSGWALVFSGGARQTSGLSIIGPRTNGPETFYVWVDDPQTPLDLESPGHGGHEKPPHSHHPSARSPDIGIAI